MRRRRASSEGSRGVTGISFGLREREVERLRWTRGRVARPRSHDGMGSGWMTIAESCVLLSPDELPEVDRNIAFVSTDRFGWVGVGCTPWLEVFKSGWW